MPDTPDSGVSQWLRSSLEEVIPGAVEDRQKIRRAFDLIGLSSLKKSAAWENKWREIDSLAAHRKLYGTDPEQSGEAVEDDMIVLGDYKVEVNSKPDAAPVPPVPQAAPPSQPSQPTAAASTAAKFGMGTMLALAAGSGLAGAAIPAAIMAMRPDAAQVEFEDTFMVPELTGDWEKVEE